MRTDAAPAAPPALRAAAPVDAAPVASPVTLDAAGRSRAYAAIGSRLGRFDAARQCIRASVRQDTTATSGCIAIVRSVRVAASGRDELFLILSGRGDADCHACAGLMAFVVLDTGGTQTVAAMRDVELSGAYGRPVEAKDFRLQRLGSDRWGWTVPVRGFGQGVLEGMFQIHLRTGATFTTSTDLPGDYDDSGACGEDGRLYGQKRCSSRTMTLVVDASNPALDAYPVKLQAVIKAARRTARHQIVAAFDPARQIWATKDEWPDP